MGLQDHRLSTMFDLHKKINTFLSDYEVEPVFNSVIQAYMGWLLQLSRRFIRRRPVIF